VPRDVYQGGEFVHIRGKALERLVSAVIAGVVGLATAGCGSVFITEPASNETIDSGSVTMRIQKNDRSCSFSNGSFEAFLNRGLADEIEITSAFTRPPNSNVWTATDFPLSPGSYALWTQVEFTGSLCGSGRTSTDSRRFEIIDAGGGLRYDTSCGAGQFTYEPYPAVIPPGAVNPPVQPISSNAHCVSPGSTLRIENLRQSYPDIGSIRSLELAVLHTRYDPNAVGAGGQGVWFRLVDPTYHDITQFNLTANGRLTVTIPTGITGEPPAAATLRMTYVDTGNVEHVVDIEADRRANVYDNRLFFVPTYKVYLAQAQVAIGSDLLDHTVEGEVLPGFAQSYPSGWEAYCRIRKKEISDSGFPGTASFRTPDATVRNPNQGYRVQMPSTRSGTFDVTYQVVCPEDVSPSGQNLFTSWGLLGDFAVGPSQGSLLNGMPAITTVASP
jgi:hypothetical protein